AAATAGLLAGIFAADRLAAAPYDYSTADVSQVALGGVAGALLGAGVAVLAEPSASGTLALVTSGAMLGVFAGHAFAAPTRARTTAQRVGSTRRVSLEVDPTALALGASRVPGTHAVLS